MEELTVRTDRRQVLVDITDRVQEAVRGWRAGAVLIYVPHTTVGVLVNEHADPDVARDILSALDRAVPDVAGYRHAEGNAPAHVKASLVGTSQTVPLRDGEPALGTWQGIFLAEFDGPRTRTVWLVPLAAAS